MAYDGIGGFFWGAEKDGEEIGEGIARLVYTDFDANHEEMARMYDQLPLEGGMYEAPDVLKRRKDHVDEAGKVAGDPLEGAIAADDLAGKTTTVASLGGLFCTSANGIRNTTKGKFRGGLHGSTKGPVGDGLASHHMPAKSVSGLHPNKGPAIQMEPADHALTASHGSQPGSDFYRLRQQRLIKQGRFGDAIQLDIDNIRSLFGDKYDEAIREMLEQLEPWMRQGVSG